jgi:glutamine amidotransferase-like uncharacterized protein
MRWQLGCLLILIVWLLGSCAKPESSTPPDDVPPTSSTDGGRTDVLIYGGVGSWRAEIESLKKILYHHQATYVEMSPSEINKLSLQEISNYRLIIFPGGDAPTVRKALSFEARSRIRQAVQQGGLNYLGFCSGAWLAVAPAPAAGEDVVYGIGVVDGPLLQTNFLSQQGKKFSLDVANFPGGHTRKLLWYGGPVTVDRPGSVVARYSDGTAAISQIRSGKGFVIISGFHPAADKPILSWLGIYESEAIAPDFAWDLLHSALEQKPLPAF